MPIKIDPKEIAITHEDLVFMEKYGIAVKIPDELYKYYRINDDLIYTIKENYFWLSKPSNFNDPFDARILVNTNNTVEEIDSHISEIFEKSELKEDARNIYKNLKTKDPELFTQFVNVNYQHFLENIGISCFTTKNNNLLMWAHYADNHKGVCIKFNLLGEDSITDILYSVEYSQDYPKINFINLLKERNFQDLFLVKSLEWIYENEWRLVRTKYLTTPGEKEDENAPKNYGKLSFEKELLLEVIFGCKATDEDIEKVISVFKSANYKSVSFKKAEMIDFKFDLSFTEILTL